MSEPVIFLYCEVCQERTPHNADDECLRCIADIHAHFDKAGFPHEDELDDFDDIDSDEFYDDYDEA